MVTDPVKATEIMDLTLVVSVIDFVRHPIHNS